VATFGLSICLQFDREQIDFLNAHLDSADREVSLSVQPLFNNFFSE
jgi:ubiquinone biosynthesis protein UbiJ